MAVGIVFVAVGCLLGCGLGLVRYLGRMRGGCGLGGRIGWGFCCGRGCLGIGGRILLDFFLWSIGSVHS